MATPPAGSSLAGAARAAAPAAATAAGSICPDCATPRSGTARFCEVCRYDFVVGRSFDGLPATPPPAAPASAERPVALAPAEPTPAQVTVPVPVPDPPAVVNAADGVPPPLSSPRALLLLRILVDASLYKDPDPATPCPTSTPEKVFHLDLAENTVGRQFDGKGVCPEIVIHDPGISRRHLKFIRDRAGQYSALELGSANGTEFNGAVLDAGVVTPIRPGDQLTLGMWTRIRVEAR
jgi:hypothetical protein